MISRKPKEKVAKRVFAYPNKHTFTIHRVRKLLSKDGVGKGWIDPFAGWNSPAEITNDLNPEAPTQYHMKALDFVNSLSGMYDGALIDPPYSLRQMKESYNGVGIEKLTWDETHYFPLDVMQVIAGKIKPGGITILFGWSSYGFGKEWGFEYVEGLTLVHGRRHHDTLITVERKLPCLL